MLARPIEPFRRQRVDAAEFLGPALVRALDRIDVLSRKVFEGKIQGERRSKRLGQSTEFHEHRAYAPGDDLRRIDWNAFARLDRLFIRVFQADEDLSVHVILDGSASMHAGEPDKLRMAQRLAVAIAYVGLVKRNRVVVSVIGAPGRPGVQTLRAVRGRSNVNRIASFLLSNCHPDERDAGSAMSAGGMASQLRSVCGAAEGKGVAVLISDFLTGDDLGGAMSQIATRFDTWALHVMSPQELDPRLSVGAGLVGDLRLTDAESGAGAEVTVSEALVRRYVSRLDRHMQRLATLFSSRGIRYLLVPSDASVESLLLRTLRERGMLG